MENIAWILSGISILGAILNIQKKAICFIVWTIANIGWMTLALFEPKFRPQIPLWVVFTLTNIWGYLEWKK
jgi:hypothetical protein